MILRYVNMAIICALHLCCAHIARLTDVCCIITIVVIIIIIIIIIVISHRYCYCYIWA